MNFRAFFDEVEGWSYESLRKMLAGERTLQPDAIDAMARALDVPPAYFREYRLWQIEQRMAEDPEVVDVMYEIVMGFEEGREEGREGKTR
ncbi:MAG: helix-turn-helix domain-containing protein [Actinobacteria bacterium]|nr:helix-turn-helix domain-containing protein [Actinomycetota bacterium]